MADATELVTVEALRAQIETARKEWSERAKTTKPRVFRYTLVAAILGAAAVLFLAVQVVVLPGEGLATVLIALEIGCLLAVIFSSLMPVWPSPEHWVQARLKAELLRREEFLMLARVGPYLGCAAAGDLEPIVGERVPAIGDCRSTDALLGLLRLETGGVPWRHQLEDSRGTSPALLTEDCCRDYRARRIEGQKGFYQSRSEQFAAQERLWMTLAQLSLGGALVVAIVHLRMVGSPSYAAGAAHHAWDLCSLAAIAAISLPPLGSAISAVRSLYQWHRLRPAYEDHVATLGQLGARWKRLETGLKAEHTDQDEADLQFRLKRLVLETEELLSGEVRQWYLIVSH